MGGLSPSRNFYLRTYTHVKFMRLNVEAMYDRPRINVKVEQGSTFAYKRDLPHVVSILFRRVRVMSSYARKN